MKRVIAYLIVMLAIYGSIGCLILFRKIVFPNELIQLAVYCGLFGGIGGITYCFRGIYLNACVYKKWDTEWLPWYFIRPLVSFICGIISFLFLKAGLIVLEAQQSGEPTYLAFYALAFVAGLNADKFIEKVEDVAQVTWGIKKTRVSTKENNNA